MNWNREEAHDGFQLSDLLERSGMVRPTASAQRLESNTYVARNGFGHEEWLFSPGRMINGKRYGHLEPVSRKSGYRGETVDLVLNSRVPRRVYLVGVMKDVDLLSEAEATEALRVFKQRGWLNQMAEDLRALRLNPRPLLQASPLETFNIAFDPGKVDLLDPLLRIEEGHPNYPAGYRYQLNEVTENGSGGQLLYSIGLPSGSTNPPPLGGRSTRRAISAVEVGERHTKLQRALGAYLESRCGEVWYERGCVDVSIDRAEGRILFEVKIAHLARTCIRAGLGQLLEYGHYVSDRGDRGVSLFCIVGSAPLTETDRDYLDLLKERYQMPIAYWYFPLDEDANEARSEFYPPTASQQLFD